VASDKIEENTNDYHGVQDWTTGSDFIAVPALGRRIDELVSRCCELF